MSSPAIDYAALADQARKVPGSTTSTGPVDYSALADVARKTPEPAAPTSSDDEPNDFLTSPHGFIREGLRTIGQGAHDLVNNPGWDAKAGAVAKMARGVGSVLAPVGIGAAIPAMVAAPLATGAAIGAGAAGAALGGAGARMGAEALHAGPGMQDLAETGGQLAGGVAASIPGYAASKSLGQAAASGMANSALGTTPRNRWFGRNPGQAALAETTGIAPETVGESAATRSKAITDVKEATLAQSKPVDLTNARKVLADAMETAKKRGDKSLANEVTAMQDTLSANQVTGEKYGDQVPASQALDILRGFANQHPNFVPGRSGIGNDTAKRAWGALRNDIQEVAPQTEDMDTRVSNLLEVQKQAGKAQNAAGIPETAVNRLTRPTGGLAPTIAATFAGGPGAGLATLAGQEALSSPPVRMALARGLYRGVGGQRLGVPEMPPQVTPARVAGLLGPGATITPPPADTSGPIPPQVPRGVNMTNPGIQPNRQLAAPPMMMPPPADLSGSTGRAPMPGSGMSPAMGNRTIAPPTQTPQGGFAVNPQLVPVWNEQLKQVEYVDPQMLQGRARGGLIGRLPKQITADMVKR